MTSTSHYRKLLSGRSSYPAQIMRRRPCYGSVRWTLLVLYLLQVSKQTLGRDLQDGRAAHEIGTKNVASSSEFKRIVEGVQARGLYSSTSTRALLQELSTATPFCSKVGDCQEAFAGPWCNINRGACDMCGGRWCMQQPPPTPEVPEPEAFCGMEFQCEKAYSGKWCNVNAWRCSACGGVWCTSQEPTLPPDVGTPSPEISTPQPTAQPPPPTEPTPPPEIPMTPIPTTTPPTTPPPLTPPPIKPPTSCQRSPAATRTGPDLPATVRELPLDLAQLNNTRIVGGTEAPRGRFPYMVNIASGDGFVFCGGSLLSPSTVLTAAHCKGGIKKVFIGRHDLDEDDEVFEEIRVEDSIPHPRYDEDSSENDFMILTLREPSGALPVLLDSPGSADGVDLPINSNDGDRLNVMGWGDTEEDGRSSPVLMEVELAYVSNRECDDAYGDITDSMLCAYSRGKDSCQGDSGGPIIVKKAGAEEDVQVGVVSFGKGCARKGYPGVYARVTEEYEWIKREVERVGETLAEPCK